MPTLASTSRVSIQYKPETTFGVVATTGKTRDLRITGETLDFTVTKTVSTEINATRSISSQVATTASAQGGVQGEFSHGEFDVLMAATLQDAWTVSGTNGALAVATTSAFTATTITFGAATTHGLVVGQWFRMSKSGGVNDGKLFRVHLSTAPTSTVITLHASTPASVEAAVGGYSLQAARLSHGTTQSSFSIQRASNDVSPVEYMSYLGMTPSKMSLNIASGSLTTIGFDFMGKSASRGTPGTNTLAAAGGMVGTSYTSPIHAGTTATNCVIWAGGAPLTATLVKSIGLEFDNALGTQAAVCNLGAVGVRSGTINCTISMQIYFAAGATFFDQFINNTNTELVFSSTDSDGNSYVFTVPQASVATYKVNAGSKDTDLLVDVTFTALRDATLNKLLLIDRCGIAVAP